MTSTDWLSMVSCEPGLDDAASVLLSCLRYLFDVAFPVRSVRIRNTDPAWLTPQLRLLMNDRDAAWRSGKLDKFNRLEKRNRNWH